ncbi:M14 family metallopeptidase [Paenibacillus assamensis]|uniref:M14 family metallopeptidase n=1 Tax=Paenibacillus assamensis TaxID=311244 RepID=UPI00041A8A48|nr:M14 family metallopeptidase [Paenibacillus assamensis]
MSTLYMVRKGDTPLRICLRCGITLEALLAANPTVKVSPYLMPGQHLFIPERPPAMYTVQVGDSWESIAWRLGISEQLLKEANESVRSCELVPGLCISLAYAIQPSDWRARAEYGPLELEQDVKYVQRTFPGIAHVESIGNSVLGKEIFAIRIGEGPRRIHVNGAVHANEWLTSSLLMQFVEEYARYLQLGLCWGRWNAGLASEHTSVWFVPMVNPDGVELVQEGVSGQHSWDHSLVEWNEDDRRFDRWKANIRGVDLNDQFPAYWEEERARRGVFEPSAMNYSGEAPLTEPEACALYRMAEEKQFAMALSFHSQGREIYWNYRDYEPSEAEVWAKKLAQVSGYRAVKLTGSDAGFKDWFIQQYRKPAFTIEVGYGINPLPLSQFGTIYHEVCAILKEALLPE